MSKGGAGPRARGRGYGGPRTYLAVEADLTPNLRAGELRARLGQRGLYAERVRMRGAEDPPSPLEHVLHDCLGFEQVIACVEIKMGRGSAARIGVDSNAGCRGCAWGFPRGLRLDCR